MARVIDLKVRIGNSSSVMNPLPCAIDSASPVISWTLPDGIEQKRFNVKINPVHNKGLFINGSLVSSQTSFQYPTGTQMSSSFYGLCSLEIAISEKTSGEYELTSGELYFVFDDVLEVLKIDDSYVFRWNNAIDNETTWDDMQYNLVVSGTIDFNKEDIIFDGIINATSRSETSYVVKIEKKYDFVYWKVRAFDGIDYSDFSQINAFRMTDNEAPIINIESVEVLDNSNKDVKINFEIKDSLKDRLNLEVYYCGGTVSSKYVFASLINSVVSVKPGKYSIIWRSSLDEQKISSSDYRIRITAIDDEGLYGTDTSDVFFMDNRSVGIDAGGEASLNNDYTITGRMAILHRKDSEDNYPVSGKTKDCVNVLNNNPTAFIGKMGTFKKYRTGALNYPLSSPDLEYDENPDDWVFDNGSDEEDEDEIKPVYPHGMAIFQEFSNSGEDIGDIGTEESSGGEKATDLDSSDPDFIRDNVYVDEDGNYWEMDERISYKSVGNIRWGYARFLNTFYACGNAKCQTCGGKGWNGVEEDPTIPKTHKYRYKRKVCQTCLGNRFTEPNTSPKEVEFSKVIDSVKKDETIVLTGGKELMKEDFKVAKKGTYLPDSEYVINLNENSATFLKSQNDIIIFYKMKKYIVKNSLFSVSRWEPLEKYFFPLSKAELIHNCKVGDSKIIDPMSNFVFAPTIPSSWFGSYSYGESNSKSGIKFNAGSLPEKMHYQVDCPILKNNMYKMSGVYNGVVFEGRTGVKQPRLAEVSNYRLEGNAHVEKLKLEEHVSALRGKLLHGKEDYVPGTSYKESVFMNNKKVPTHKWEPGIFGLVGSLYREQNLGPLKIIFLQNNWQVYNTIHWSGPMSASSMTQVQYCKMNDDGSNGVFYDVISENADYYPEQGIWLIRPQMSHCYWKTENQIKRDNESRYRIRIRQYNVVSKTFTAWSYSETTFMIKDVATNPASIYYVEYRKFSKKLYIYYRLDDKDNEEFNIVSIAYKVGDEDWVEINTSDIDGDMSNLSSNPGQDGDGNKHLIVWNTSSYGLRASDDYRIRIDVIKTKLASGYSEPLLKWIKTPNTTSDRKERDIELYQGTWVRTYWDENDKIAKALTQPFFQPGKIQELENEIFKIRCQNEPLPNGCDGYFTFLLDGGVELKKDDSGKIISANILNNKTVGSVEIDGKTYKLVDWLNYKIDGVSRNNLIYNYSREINSYIEIINNARTVINEARDYTRRNLIDQGYYCNGFKNNTPVYIYDGSNSDSESEIIDDNCYFKFKVLTYFDDSKNDKGFFEPKYSEYLGDVLFTETITDVTEDGKTNTVTYEFHEYERTADVFSRIVMDKYPKFNSQNGKPLRDMIIVDNERIATTVGGDNYASSTIPGYNPAFGEQTNDSILEVKNSTLYEVFTIPKNLFPGEMEGDITDTDTFEGDYKWKVSSYNLLYGKPEEQPEFVASSSFDRDIITLDVMTTAPSDMTDAKINDIYFIDKLFNKYLIEKDGSNSDIEYFDDSHFLSGNNIIKESVFVTDPDDDVISKGYCSGFTWTPLSKKRSRPVVFFDRFDEKLFWYIKENVYGEKVLCMAKGKTLFRLGEHSMAIPSSNIKIDTEITGVKDIFSHSIIYVNGLYIMYYMVNLGSEYAIKIATSTDAHEWSHGEVHLPRYNIYNLFATLDGQSVVLYYSTYEDGKFNIYKCESSDGLNFSSESLFYFSNNVISNFCILSHNDEKILFYTEEKQGSSGYIYNIKNNSNGIFPEIENASNPYIIKEGLGYRMFFDRDGKIYSVFMKNYIEKNLVKESDMLKRVVSGDLDFVRSSDFGFVTRFLINRKYYYGNSYYCHDDLVNMDLNNLIGWVIKGENNAKHKEFRVEGQFLTSDNKNSVQGEMEPYPFKYMSVIKDLY